MFSLAKLAKQLHEEGIPEPLPCRECGRVPTELLEIPGPLAFVTHYACDCDVERDTSVIAWNAKQRRATRREG